MNYIFKLFLKILMIVAVVVICRNTPVLCETKLCLVSFKENFYKDNVKNEFVASICEKLGKNDINVLSFTISKINLKLLNKINIKKINKIFKVNNVKYSLLGKIKKVKSGFKLKLCMYDVKRQTILNVSKVVIGVRKTRNIKQINNNYIKKILINVIKKRLNFISKIYVVGNHRIKKSSVLRIVDDGCITSNLQDNNLQKYAKLVYNIGCFDVVYVSCEKYNGRFVLIIRVKENPIINKIFFKSYGNNNEILKNNLNINEGSFFRLRNVVDTITRLRKLFKEKNYYETSISYSIQKMAGNKINLSFFFDSKKNVFVKKIFFYGNKSFSFETLESIIKSSKKKLLYWVTGIGKLNEESLLNDCNMISNFYREKGFINVRVSKPIVNIKNMDCAVIFIIEEGNRFQVGNCLLSGDITSLEKTFLKNLNSFKDKWINLKNIQLDILKLSNEYSNIGYPDVQIYPEIISNSNGLKDLVFKIKKNRKKVVKHIEISGNSITNDFVIRRELKIKENDVYSIKKIEDSIYNLRKLGYFESVTSKKIKYEKTNNVGLNFKVKEKPTGQISFGAGYSTSDKFFVNGAISKENFMGKGTSLRISGTLGNENDKYNIMFSEPWLFDVPISTTLSFYKEVENNVNNSVKKQKQIDTGFYIGTSYPLATYIRLSLSYNYNVSKNKIKRVVATKLEKKYTISSTTLAVSYDSRKGIFYTQKGALYRMIFTHAGFGGDLNFIKIESNIGCYIPLYGETILYIRGKYGQIKDLYNQCRKDKYKPLREKDFFKQGGMNSVRAYDYNTIGTKMIKDSNDNVISSKGGTQYLLFNVELIYPLKKEINLLAVIFYDAGQVYNKRMGDFKDGLGCGIRWYSPIGPIRLEGAYKINDLDKEIKWNFAIGAPF